MPGELADIANRACHRDKDQRFASAEAFRDALQDFVQHRESVVLSQSAEAKLVELEELLAADSRDVLAIHDTYGECRFGFFQALRMWPENDQATHGLQRCLETMADYHLEQGSLDADGEELKRLEVFYAAAALGGVLWPEWQLYFNTAATALTLGGLAWIWSPSRMDKKVSLSGRSQRVPSSATTHMP